MAAGQPAAARPPVERDAAEARLALLQSQLEPHMLFNTLANLRALIASDPLRAQTMLDQLIAFLRATLGASRTTLHPLADELARLDDYLHLMQCRMGARLQARLDLPDDLAALATSYFYTRGRAQRQQVRLAAAERDAAEARLALLQSQLEPHMLFNTLANLRALIASDPARAQAMLDQLIAFLRATLGASRTTLHPLADEFARLGDYLHLMQIRMGARLQARLDLPDELAAHPVPPLVLQPLVENAIQHGLEPHVAGGRLEVSAMREAGELVLRVRDTGAGLSHASTGGSHFGLQQVRERLAAMYGATATLELAAAADGDGGTLATIRMPMRAAASDRTPLQS